MRAQRSITIVCAAALGLAAVPARAAARPAPSSIADLVAAALAAADGDQADDLYREGRDAIDEGQFDRAIQQFRKLAQTAQARADGALYWIAYAQNKLNQRAEALATLADLQRRFASSRWAKDARGLELEIRQASGQKVSPDAEPDDDLRLLVLTNLSHTDPTRTLAALEPLLASRDASTKVKERALFVLSQMQDPKATAILTRVAKDNANADLQARALRYIGISGSAASRQILDEVYRTAIDVRVKRSVLRSLMVANDRERLLALAKSESSPELRGDAIQQLGVLHAVGDLSQLYQAEQTVELKKKILQALFIGNGSDRLIEVAKTEKDPELRRTAIRDLGLMNTPAAGEALTTMYASDPNLETRKAVVNALFLQNNAHALVTLARAEKNPEMKKEIVSKLALMHSKEATDYLMELLK